MGLRSWFLRALGASGRLTADTAAATGGAIELVDDVGAAILVSLLGEPHVALGQICPLRPQRRARFPGSAGTQMCGKRTISLGGAHLVASLTQTMSFYTSPKTKQVVTPFRASPKIPNFLIGSSVSWCTLAFPPGSQASGALTKFRSQG